MPSSGFYKAETQSRGSKDEKIPLIEGCQTQSDGVDSFHRTQFLLSFHPYGIYPLLNFKIPLCRRGVRRTGWFLIPRWQTQSDGVDYLPNPNRAPLFSPSPSGKVRMGQTEMPHSFQRTKILKELVYQIY
jgi:hypothetical protein